MSVSTTPESADRGAARRRGLRFASAAAAQLCALAALEPSLELPMSWALCPGAAIGWAWSWKWRLRATDPGRLALAGVAVGGAALALARPAMGAGDPVVAGAEAAALTTVGSAFVAASPITARPIRLLTLVLLLAAVSLGGGGSTRVLVAASGTLLVLHAVTRRTLPPAEADAVFEGARPGVARLVAVTLLVGGLAAPVAYTIDAVRPTLTERQRASVRSLLGMGGYQPQRLQSGSSEPPRPDPGWVEDATRPAPAGGRFGGGTRAFAEINLSSETPSPSGQVLFRARGPRRQRFRLQVLGVYDGRMWHMHAVDEPQRLSEFGGRVTLPARGVSVGARDATLLVDIRAGIGHFLPRPRDAVAASAPTHQLYTDGTGNVLAYPAISPPTTYRLYLGSKGVGSATRERPSDAWLRVPSLSERVKAFAARHAEGLEQPRAVASALERALHEQCRYALTSHRIPSGSEATDHFLFVARRGWCTHFASALAVLCRSAGVPSRVVTGFLVEDARRAKRDQIRVRDTDAHSWVEVFVPDQGWVAFDPTPAARTTGSAGAGSETGRGAEDPGGGARAFSSEIGPLAFSRRFWVLVALAACLLLAVVGIIRARVRKAKNNRRAGARGPLPRDDRSAAARTAYRMAADHLARRGYGQVHHTLPAEYVARLRETDPEGAAALERITEAYELAAFGERDPDCDPERLTEDLRRVQRA